MSSVFQIYIRRLALWNNSVENYPYKYVMWLAIFVIYVESCPEGYTEYSTWLALSNFTIDDMIGYLSIKADYKISSLQYNENFIIKMTNDKQNLFCTMFVFTKKDKWLFEAIGDVYLPFLSFSQHWGGTGSWAITCGREGLINCLQSVPWLLMTWWSKEPGHQKPPLWLKFS